jgi:hypothetical protein
MFAMIQPEMIDPSQVIRRGMLNPKTGGGRPVCGVGNSSGNHAAIQVYYPLRTLRLAQRKDHNEQSIRPPEYQRHAQEMLQRQEDRHRLRPNASARKPNAT